jgi:hypothetical protein
MLCLGHIAVVFLQVLLDDCPIKSACITPESGFWLNLSPAETVFLGPHWSKRLLSELQLQAFLSAPCIVLGRASLQLMVV